MVSKDLLTSLALGICTFCCRDMRELVFIQTAHQRELLGAFGAREHGPNAVLPVMNLQARGLGEVLVTRRTIVLRFSNMFLPDVTPQGLNTCEFLVANIADLIVFCNVLKYRGCFAQACYFTGIDTMRR